MFQDLRKNAKSWIVYLLFGMIIFVFAIEIGVGSANKGCSGEEHFAAHVNGDVITQAEFRFTYNNYYDFYQRWDPNFNTKKAKEMGIAKMALDALVDQVLLSQKAENLGFLVTPKEVSEQIMATPYFQTNEKFDRELYNKVVQFQMGMTISAYEEKVRKQLLADKLRIYIETSADIPNREVEDEYVNQNETIDTQLVIFSDKELKEEAKAKLTAAINDQAVAEFEKTQADRIKMFYDDNKARYVKDEEIQASHILIKVDDKTNDAAAKTKIDAIYKDVKAGKDFAELAKQNSQCPSAPKGGDLGYFARGRMVPEFDNAAFALKNKGDISDIVKTQFGYHIIKLTDRKERSETKLEGVKIEIARELMLKDKMKGIIEAEAKKALDLIGKAAGQYKAENLKKDFPDWNLELKDQKDIRKGSKYVPGVGIVTDFVQKLFAVANVPALLNEIYMAEDKAVVAYVTKHQLADMAKFDTEKESIRKRLQSMKTREVLEQYLKELRKNARVEQNNNWISNFSASES